MAAAMFRTVFAQPSAQAAFETCDEVRDRLNASFPKAGPLMDAAKAEVLAFAGFPRAHWQKIWSTNPPECINKEIKRRSRVVGIFPNAPSAIRLVGAILADMHDERQATTPRRYLLKRIYGATQRTRCYTNCRQITPRPDQVPLYHHPLHWTPRHWTPRLDRRAASGCSRCQGCKTGLGHVRM